MALNALNVGPDGILYGIDGTTLVRSTDHGVTWEEGAEATASGAFGDPVRILKTGAGIVVVRSITTAGNEHGYLLFTDDFNTPMTLVKASASGEETFFTRIATEAYYDGALDLVMIGEYGWNMVERNLWLSTDGGQTYSSVLTTPQESAGSNSHVHCAAYDPYGKMLWCGIGDADNSLLAFSYDLGTTWETVEEGGAQPTSIMPMPERVAFGIDDSALDAGAFHIERSKPFEYTQAFTISPVQTGPQQYGQEPAVDGATVYAPWINQPSDGGTNPHEIWATGDSGQSWHQVWSSSTVRPHNLCMDGRWLYAIAGGELLKWERQDWVDPV